MCRLNVSVPTYNRRSNAVRVPRSPTGESAQMRGFATGVGSKADIGGPPRRARGKDSTMLPRRYPKYYIVRFLLYA